MLTTLALLTSVLYLISGILQGLCMTNKAAHWIRITFILSLIAIISHAYLLHRWIDVVGGQNLTFFNTLSQVLWISALVVWFMALRRPVVNLGVILYPLTGLSIILVLLFSGSYIVNTGAEPQRLLHTLFTFFSFGILVIAALQAIFLTVLDRALHKKYSNRLIESLPPLQSMESLLFQMIALGFILLGIVIYTGFIYYSSFGSVQLWQHVFLPIIAWGVFGVLLFGRIVFGWRGAMAIRWFIIGALLLFFAFISSHFWSF